jgi:hypothetical protein
MRKLKGNMNTPRKIERGTDGVLLVELTPEETARWQELDAAVEQVEVALYDAKLAARRAASMVLFYSKYRQALKALIQPLHKIHLPEFHQK